MDDPLDPSPYKTLNVPKDASLATIRSAHRKLVLSCHPDKVQEESAKKVKAEQFHLVQQAYEILSDESKRRRWDERAKLAELRAEMMEDRGPPRKADYVPPKPGQSPIFEMRGGRIYEERVPKGSRAYEEDVFSSKFADARPSSKKYDDRYADTPLRRTSGRGQDDRRTSNEADIRYEKRVREAEAAARDQRTRRRDKDRRKDVEAKFRSKASYAENGSSDSESHERYYSSKNESRAKRKEDPPKRSREEPLRRASKKERDYDDELDRKIYGVQDYMSKSREAVEIEPRRPGRNRAASNLDRRPAPPPPSPPFSPVDTGRRSSGDDSRRPSGRGRNSRAVSPVKKGGRDKRVTEIADPPSNRKPSMASTSSDPRGLKSIFSSSSKPKGDPQRSATYTPSTEFKHPGMRRSETLPVNQMRRGDPVPLKSSHLKNAKAPSDASESTDISDSDSDATPVIHPRSSPRQQSTKYKIHEDDDDRRARTSVLDHEDIYARPRDVSPKSHRRPSDRPFVAGRGSSNARIPLPRASSYACSPDERPSPRHTFSRTESARMPPPKIHTSTRGGGQLFGEVSEENSPKSHHGSPKLHVDDVRYTKPFNRRGSGDVDRDAYPGSHRRPHPNRSEVYV
ncbi:MAG: hypothetical protein Q9217_005190 [Psora testacea]